MRAARVFLLNDLFVAEHARRSGVALALLSAAADYGQREGAIRLDLETMPDNHAAQTLYRTGAGVNTTARCASSCRWHPRDRTTNEPLQTPAGGAQAGNPDDSPAAGERVYPARA